MLHRSSSLCLIVAICLIAGAAWAQDALSPREVKVLPIFLVPKGEPAPTDDQTKRLMQHLDWCQRRYRELLRNQTTFAIADRKPRIHRSSSPLAFYRGQPDSAAQVVSELLTELKFTRYNCPYILLVAMMNAKDGFPAMGGRPLNGGVNTGGGIIILSSFALDRSPNFQSTLQHEAGHAFGLPHVAAYRYDMKTNDSIMSYNPKHHTKGFTPGQAPGKLVPEDFRALALNTRAFPKLRFDPEKDVPEGYTIAPRVLPLPPMKIPGQPDGVTVTTESGEAYGSKVGNIVQGWIVPSRKVGKITFEAKAMWHSAKAETGWVSVQVAFPYEVELTRIMVHSEHSGECHAAKAMRGAVRDTGGEFRQVVEADLKSVDDTVTLPKTKGQVWRLEFQAGTSGHVVLRGLRFFLDDDELFPPLVPYHP